MERLGIDKKYSNVLEDTIKQRIKPSEVEIKGRLKLATFEPDGVEIIKGCLKKAEESAKGRVNINYLGSGMFRFMVKAPDYKEAEKIMKNASDAAISFFAKHNGTAEFSRESE